MAYSALYHNLFGNKKGGNPNKRSFQDIIKLFNEKKGFLLKIFSNLIFQLIVTFIVAIKAQGYDILNTNMSMIGMFILTLVILFLIFIIQNPIIKFILFTIFSILFGLMLSRTLMVSSPEIIKTALIGTLSIFVTMFLFTIFLLMIGVNLDDRFGLILLFALIIMIITMVVLHFMDKYSAYKKIISGILLFLFSLFIVYDTSNILTREEYMYNGDYITASMDYYLDIINIFVNMLSINQ